MGLLTIVALSGCDRRSVHLKPDELLPKCTTTFDISVDELATTTLTCAAIESYVVFPDGYRFQVKSGSKIVIREPNTYSVIEFGIHGLVASHQESNEPAQWWGSTDKAIELGKYLDGSQ